MAEEENQIQRDAEIPQVAEGTRRLVGPMELLAEAWKVYTRNITTFIGVIIAALIGYAILAGILTLLASGLVVSGGNSVNVYMVVAMAVIAILGFIIYMWAYASILEAICHRNDRIRVLESIKKSWPLLLPLIWVMIITFFITTGGYFVFIIPGIILSVWFTFAPYVLIAENERGLGALVKSREYVRGYWWPVLGRVVLIGIVGGIIGILIGMILALIPDVGKVLENVVGQAVMLLVTPFFMTYMYLLYEDMKAVKGEVPSEASKRQKVVYTIFTVITILFFVAGYFAMMAYSYSHSTPDVVPYPSSGYAVPSLHDVGFPAR